MKGIVSLTIFIVSCYSLHAQSMLGVFTPAFCDSTAINVYEKPGGGHKVLPNKTDEEVFYLLRIVDKEGNFFKVEPRGGVLEEYGFNAWIHTGDVYTIIQKSTERIIRLYCLPQKGSFSTCSILEDEICAVYDICNEFVLVNLLDKKHIWGWVHKCHLNDSPYTTNTSIDNIEP